MPLYPLPAVYLPTAHHQSCQLRNTERRNVQMALDVGLGGEFCVVLRAMDTGRIATHGTVLRILDMDVTRTTTTSTTTLNDDNSNNINDLTTIQRILVTCRPERIVEIVEIENPEAAKLEYRLRHAHEYLKASVQTPTTTHQDAINTSTSMDLSTLCLDIQQNYQVVRQFYLNGIANMDTSIWGTAEAFGPLAQSLPEKLPLPCFDGDDRADTLVAEQQLWKTMEIWQSWCETVREIHQRRLVADRNELLVEMALQRQNGKPLRLPIRVDDSALWLPADRQRVSELETQAQQLWWDWRLDPCLDFQTIVTLSSWSERLQHFQRMLVRERCRLEQELMANSKGNSRIDASRARATPADNSIMVDDDATVTRKGAWFDDNCW